MRIERRITFVDDAVLALSGKVYASCRWRRRSWRRVPTVAGNSVEREGLEASVWRFGLLPNASLSWSSSCCTMDYLIDGVVTASLFAASQQALQVRCQGRFTCAWHSRTSGTQSSSPAGTYARSWVDERTPSAWPRLGCARSRRSARLDSAPNRSMTLFDTPIQRSDALSKVDSASRQLMFGIRDDQRGSAS